MSAYQGVAARGLKMIVSRTLTAGADVFRTTAFQVPPGFPPAAKCDTQAVPVALVEQPGSWRVVIVHPVPVAMFMVKTIADPTGAARVTS